MTEHAYPRSGTADVRERTQSRTNAVEGGSRWSGRLGYAGAMMIVAGLFNVVIGLVALFKSGYYVVGPSGLLVLNLTGWGWLHLILGFLVAVTGVVVFGGATWARVITVLLAAFNALASVVFISAYPLWSLVVIALDILVIWAVMTADTEAEA